MMGPADAVARCFLNYATFTGRAPRAEFWWFLLFLILGQVAAAQIEGWLGLATLAPLPETAQPQPGFEPLFVYEAPGPIGAAFGLATLLPFLAVTVRRLHDRAQTAWWLLALLVPLAGWIVLLLFCGLEGSQGENPYGPVPEG